MLPVFALEQLLKQVGERPLLHEEGACLSRMILVVDIDKAEVEMPEWQDWLIGIPVLIALLVILLVEVTDR